MQGDKIHVAPGVFDGLTARMVEQKGFDLIYASGGAIARSCGFPDIGLLSFTEVLLQLEHIVEVARLPIIADADTGFGNAINVSRTVQAFERVGVAALHLEDQLFPKRCGHLDNKSLISKEEMVKKVRVAKASQSDEDFVIIARTDAIAVEGFDAAIDRAQDYLAAGADMIFVEAPETIEQIEKIADLLSNPSLLICFMVGKHHWFHESSWKSWAINLSSFHQICSVHQFTHVNLPWMRLPNMVIVVLCMIIWLHFRIVRTSLEHPSIWQ